MNCQRGLTKVLALLLLLCFQSCISGVKVTTSNSLEEIRAAIKMISGDVKSLDSDGRRFETNYFSKNAPSVKNTIAIEQRYYARFTIAGDKRPFDIVIQVFREVKSGGKWREDGQDVSLAQMVSQDLENALKGIRQQRNAIDSFRPF